MINISVTGLQQIDNVLQALPKSLTHSVLSTAHLNAARPLIEREHLLAPVRNTGNLAESIGGIRTNLKNAQQIGEVRVGPRIGGRYKGYAGKLVEFGTKRRLTRRGANRGVMPKKPFAYPAFRQTKSQVESGIAVNIAKVLLRTMKRYIKNA